MDIAATVAGAGILIGVLGWLLKLWLQAEFSRIDTRLEGLDSQHNDLSKGLTRVHKRVDYLILKLLPDNPFKGDDDE